MPEKALQGNDPSRILTCEEIVTAVCAAAELGIGKIRITGGEPLLRKDILRICEEIAATPGISELSLTTNGQLLPALADDLVRAGVARINISLDTLSEEKYRYMTGGSLSDALKGLEAARLAGFSKVKINTVLIGGFNEDEIEDLAGLTVSYPVDVRFIELMPMTQDNVFGPDAYLSCEAVKKALDGKLTLAGTDGVAQVYRMENALGSIGLIRPLTESFCRSCNRMRLTADGKIKPCLHDALEIPIAGLDAEGMKEAFRRAAACKPEEHGELSCGCFSNAGRDMNRIGG